MSYGSERCYDPHVPPLGLHRKGEEACRRVPDNDGASDVCDGQWSTRRACCIYGRIVKVVPVSERCLNVDRSDLVGVRDGWELYPPF